MSLKKICPQCLKEGNFTLFKRLDGKISATSGVCHSCRYNNTKLIREKQKLINPAAKERLCEKCNTIKSVEEFKNKCLKCMVCIREQCRINSSIYKKNN